MLRQFETACAAFERSGEGSLLVTKEFTFHQRFGKSRAINSNEWAAAAGTQVMNRAGHQLFSSTAFAGDQHRGLAGRNLPDDREHLLHRRRSTNHVDQNPLVRQLPLQTLGFFGEGAL